MFSKHAVGLTGESDLQACEVRGFAASNGVVVGKGQAAESGGGGVDGVDEVEDGGRADATECGEHPGQEGSVALRRARRVLVDFVGGSACDDCARIVDCSVDVGGEEGAADREIDCYGRVEEGVCEYQIDLGVFGE